MKYICTNPQELVDDFTKNFQYIQSERIKTKNSDEEAEIYSIMGRACQDFLDGCSKAADVSEIFEYGYSDGCLGSHTTGFLREQLKGFFGVVGIEKDEHGEDIIYLKYLACDRINEINRSIESDEWAEVEQLYKDLDLIPYTAAEKEQIVKAVVDKYYEDMSNRDDIIFEKELYTEGKINVSGIGFKIEPLEYTINGETLKVIAIIRASGTIMVPKDKLPTEGSLLNIDIIRRGKNNNEEILARIEKDRSIKTNLYDNPDEKPITIIRHRWYFNELYSISQRIAEGSQPRISIRELVDGVWHTDEGQSKEALDIILEKTVPQEKVDKLNDIVWRKAKVYPLPKNKAHKMDPGESVILEQTGWPEEMKGQTIVVAGLPYTSSATNK